MSVHESVKRITRVTSKIHQIKIQNLDPLTAVKTLERNRVGHTVLFWIMDSHILHRVTGIFLNVIKSSQGPPKNICFGCLKEVSH